MVVIRYVYDSVRIFNIIERYARVPGMKGIGSRRIHQHDPLLCHRTAVIQIDPVDKTGFGFVGHIAPIFRQLYGFCYTQFGLHHIKAGAAAFRNP